MRPEVHKKWMEATVKHLKRKKKILFLTTSNRWSGEVDGERPKSTALAYRMAELIGSKAIEIIEIPRLKIYPCEGNISTERGNSCGPTEALLNDKTKNPSGCHRCWSSFNNPDDELWKVSKALLESEAVVFFGSIRWGQVNSHYQRLIERLSWIENRHSTLGEDNLLQKIEAGIITVGHNWHGQEAMETQKKTLEFYGFKVPESLSWHWQFTTDENDESNEGYRAAAKAFYDTFLT